MHATTTPTYRIRLPRHRPPRRRTKCMDERQVRQSTRSHAVDALWLLILHWNDHDLPLRPLPPHLGTGRSTQERILEDLLPGSWNRIPLLHLDRHRRYSQPLLHGRIGSYLLRLLLVPLQQDLLRLHPA